MALTAASPRGWRNWRLKRRLRVALAGLAIVAVVTGVGLVLALRVADQAVARQTQRTFPARLAASQLLTSLVDQETGLRGYALTGDPDFLAPYRKGLTDEQEARARLEDLVPPGERLRVALISVDAAITAWRDQYASLHTAGIDQQSAKATIEFGTTLFNRVRETNATLDEALADQVRDAQRENDRARALILVVLGVVAVAVVAAIVALQRALQRQVLDPLADLGRQVAIVSTESHATPITPVGPPDLQEMGGGVESMRVELVRALDEIERRAAELARSNADLEQFAYVASHDLQEPLRKVASFCQLLEQRYGDQLDERAHQYIAFAVDGARRMQLLITDLLTFSRVGRTSEGFVEVDFADVVDHAWHSLDVQVAAAQGELRLDLTDDAPVRGAPSLLHLLVTNLLGNALKYRRPDTAPVVQVTSHAEGSLTRIDIADNGIGIPQEYHDRVFVIFQRLHGRDEYEGTGIGLALAKKIVEFHGGTIGIHPSPLGGARISFTLPAARSAPDG